MNLAQTGCPVLAAGKGLIGVTLAEIAEIPASLMSAEDDDVAR